MAPDELNIEVSERQDVLERRTRRSRARFTSERFHDVNMKGTQVIAFIVRVKCADQLLPSLVDSASRQVIKERRVEAELGQVPSRLPARPSSILATGRKLELVEDTPSDLRVGPEDGG